ncbi:MAG: GTPase [Candidatus Zixiibacteriota bacterium]|nr:MAG: GTPase [candidate division Zixibacteria bacterium]
MVSINYATREVTCKIVYYGPGLSGKTTNLQYIHDKVPAGTKGKMISLATEADRTLYFDFLPINIGKISGFAAKFQLYTVPGQVYYNATRKLVLRGADGLVFVADSQADKMDENIESLNNMRENLAEYGYDADEMPVVLQYNKRDLPNVLSVEEMESRLNPQGWKSFETEAVTGVGVFDSLKMIIKLVLDKARKSQSGAAQKKQPVSAPAETAGRPAGVEAREEPAPATPMMEPNPVREPAYDATTEDEMEDESPPAEDSGVEYSSLKDEESAEPAAAVDRVPDSEMAMETGPKEEIAEHKESWGQSRPYPGSTSRINRRGRRIKVSDFQSSPKISDVSEPDEATAQHEDNSEPVERQNLPSPTMAPSNRLVKQKRGFFKRLLGIK